MHVLIGLSPIWAPAVASEGIEICTANGIRLVAVPAPDLPSPSGKQKAEKDCPLCARHSAVLLPQATAALERRDDCVSRVLQPEDKPHLAGLFSGFDHLSRAPPHLS
jgi:hypothetical protein